MWDCQGREYVPHLPLRRTMHLTANWSMLICGSGCLFAFVALPSLREAASGQV